MMKHKRLLSCAHFFHGIEMLALAGALLSLVLLPLATVLALLKWLPWLLVLALPALSFGLACVWALSQCVGSGAAFMLHERIGVRASLSADGLSLEGESLRNPRFIEWSEIILVRRVYARFFPSHQVRFRDERAYQLTLQSGETAWTDRVDEAALQAQCQARGIAMEGLESRLPAQEFEPLGEQT